MEGQGWSELLVAEHEMIERAMDVLRGELGKLSDATHDAWSIQRAIDFLLEFGDRIHNQKEEQVLFPLMVERGIPESGPIRVMLTEHEAERALLQQMFVQASTLAQMTAQARAEYRQKGLEYLGIRAEHIWKENDVLYPMGRRVLTEEDGRYLVGEFQRISSETYGQTADQKFAAMLQEVEGGSRVRKSLLHNLSMEQIDAGLRKTEPQVVNRRNVAGIRPVRASWIVDRRLKQHASQQGMLIVSHVGQRGGSADVADPSCGVVDGRGQRAAKCGARFNRRGGEVIGVVGKVHQSHLHTNVVRTGRTDPDLDPESIPFVEPLQAGR